MAARRLQSFPARRWKKYGEKREDYERMFIDRQDAGRKLAKALETYRGEDIIVLALPRGGVILGYEVSRALGALLDIVVSRKIGHPLSPEYAIGVVDEKGTRILNDEEAKIMDAAWLEGEAKRQKEEARRRITTYRGNRQPLSLDGKTAILVDDGIATGLTMQLALRRAASEGAARLVVAVPVAPLSALEMLAKEGADIVVLEPPENFLSAVGEHYRRFEQVSDEEVRRLLEASAHTGA